MQSFNPMADLPLGLGMMLAQDRNAMQHFAGLSPDEQRQIIDQTHSIHSKSEMQALVHRLAGQQDL